MHYAAAICKLGALDDYNTKSPEHLHIDFAKQAYQATNRNVFISQMVTYLKQRKRAFKFDIYLRWAISEYGERNLLKNEALEAKRIPGWHIAKKSLFKPFQIDCIKLVFAIEWFEWALNKFTKNEHGRAFLHNLQDMIMVFPKATQYLKDDLTLGDGFTNVVHHCKVGTH
ncbi:helicase swr-1 [Rhizoctonia solani]|uniref:Helicase swr-1 n=1 Tax=Rhizoctonia solani TaxID=456999 RepID=A0A8H8NPE0_9AGAM|nr:helicase swr-1 [Rhizoctonia solani]QRW17521.1 helicase swr-1 [Rhizoctonia solani]